MAKTPLRAWYLVHKWTSLICTLFLLCICLTGLPLIFEEEIDHWLDPGPPYPELPASPRVDLDAVARDGRRAFPDEVVRSIILDEHEPAVLLSLSPDPDSPRQAEHWIQYDARTGLERRRQPSDPPVTFMSVMFSLHTDLFAGLPGELFLGLMAILFVAAIVSGAVLYAPFMRRLPFGTLRRERSPRLKWLDVHNFLSAVTLLWLTVLGVTGVINELATPLFGLWQATDVKRLLAAYADRPIPREVSSIQKAFDSAQAAVPEKSIVSVVYPTHEFGSPAHYVFWSKGSTVMTSRLYTPVLVDARTGQLDAVLDLPWYLRALEVSRPLHFGDYGGLPLRIIWALFDLLAIAVLLTGLWLWILRRRTLETRLAQIRLHEAVPQS